MKFEGEVLLMTRVAITVRNRANAYLVRTFIYDEKVARKMARLIDLDRPFQYGDKVDIIFRAGSNQAARVKGKPTSRPSR